MELSEIYPYLGGAGIAGLLYVLLRKRLGRLSIAWDVIIFASIITSLAVSIVLHG